MRRERKKNLVSIGTCRVCCIPRPGEGASTRVKVSRAMSSLQKGAATRWFVCMCVCVCVYKSVCVGGAGSSLFHGLRLCSTAFAISTLLGPEVAKVLCSTLAQLAPPPVDMGEPSESIWDGGGRLLRSDHIFFSPCNLITGGASWLLQGKNGRGEKRETLLQGQLELNWPLRTHTDPTRPWV